MYRALGYLHATLAHALWRLSSRTLPRLRSAVGQGTVEYVALILLVALVMAGVVAALKGYKTDQGKDLGDAIIGKIKDAVKKVQF
jgi:hypothetical protein